MNYQKLFREEAEQYAIFYREPDNDYPSHEVEYMEKAVEIFTTLMDSRFDKEVKQYNGDKERATDRYIAERNLNIMEKFINDFFDHIVDLFSLAKENKDIGKYRRIKRNLNIILHSVRKAYNEAKDNPMEEESGTVITVKLEYTGNNGVDFKERFSAKEVKERRVYSTDGTGVLREEPIMKIVLPSEGFPNDPVQVEMEKGDTLLKKENKDMLKYVHQYEGGEEAYMRYKNSAHLGSRFAGE